MDEAYTDPFEEEGGEVSLDVINASAAILARVGEALNTTTQAGFIKPHTAQTAPPATGERRSMGQVTIRRNGDTAGQIQLMMGDLLMVQYRTPDGTLAQGPEVELSEDLLIPAGVGGEFTVNVQSVRPGFDANVPEGRLIDFAPYGTAVIPNATASGNTITDSGVADRFTVAMLGRFVRFTTGPNAGTPARRIIGAATTGQVEVDGAPVAAGSGNAEIVELSTLGLVLETATELTGGSAPWLDLLAAERGTTRAERESDQELCDRIFPLADVVTEGAIRRAVGRVLNPLGISFELKEVRTDFGGFTFDGGGDDPDFFFDNGEMLSGCRLNRYFKVCLTGQGLDLGETGLWFDGTAPSGLDPNNPIGFYDNGAFDGEPWQTNDALAALRVDLDRIKALGVCYDFVRG
jgi:hypothetical protein